jgi:putative spermidine/putrescine transport system ATP-binding protein
LSGLTKRFGGVCAVDDVSFDVAEGESVALLGPSGSGKTTLLGLIAGFHVPDAGQLLLRGRDISSLAPAERNIGVVFQHYALFPHMSVVDNVAYGLKMRHWKKPARLERAREMLAMVHLAGYEDRLPRQLSGGQQQRVALARALAFEPSLLLLDEPLGALDRAIRGQMQAEIRRIHREFGTTMVHVTHDKEEALALGDRIAIMRNGKIVAADTPEGLHHRPSSSFVADFFCGYNLLPVEVLRSHSPDLATIAWFGQEVTVRVGNQCEQGTAMLAVSPGDVIFGKEPAAGTLSIKGDVEDVLYLGDVTEVTATVPGLGAIAGRVRSDGALGARPGDNVVISMPLAKAVLVPVEIGTTR